MVDFMAMVTNSYGLSKFFHTVFAGYVVAAFFVMGISAYHILRKNNLPFFKASFRIAASFGLITSLLVFATGDFHAVEVAKSQPTKFAAMEAVWETQKAAPYHLLVIPDASNEQNIVEALAIPKMLSILAYHDGNAEVRGLKEFPREMRPPVWPVFLSFRSMAALGILFMLLSLLGWLIARKDALESYPLLLKIMLYMIPLPYLANQIGWIVAEVGRQPWIVYGLLKTSDAVSSAITPQDVLVSLMGFTLLYGFLAIVDIYLLTKTAKRGPIEESILYQRPEALREKQEA
jgi:cytochrome d ubiquinol oxidase subunit I